MKDRKSGMVTAEVVETTDKNTLQGFVAVNTEVDAVVYTDEHRSYQNLPRPHQAVKHSIKEFVDGQAHTNGIESFWANLKRGYNGVYHQMSAKHLPRYVAEFEGRHNTRPMDTEDQMAMMACGSVGKRLRYTDLIGPENSGVNPNTAEHSSGDQLQLFRQVGITQQPRQMQSSSIAPR